jgi:uncharacterized protein (TIGR00255 family)
MSLSSMTGFARHEQAIADRLITVEMRSVNGRGLDLRFRMPSGFDGIDSQFRVLAAERLRRGNIQVSVNLSQPAGQSQAFKINWAAVDELAHVLKELETRLGARAPSLDGILQLRGIVEGGDAAETEESRNRIIKAMTSVFGEALFALDRARREEGQRLEQLLRRQIDEIEALTRAARGRVSVVNEGTGNRLKAQLNAVFEMTPALSEERLVQEVALLLVRSDVSEELDRLEAHISAARGFFDSAEPQGRRLEFLAQEFHREANTLCSKSTDIDLTRIGIDLKSVIDQFREQVQNIE